MSDTKILPKTHKQPKIVPQTKKSNNEIEMCEYEPVGSKPTDYAVYLRNARKTYGFKFNEHVVFDNLNVTVPKGKIYALLGASGCGKTTLLSCILGYKKLNSGKVWVLGGPPGTKYSKVPGSSVGYMPQEMGLYSAFTINETLLYFGWVSGMSTKEVKVKRKFLKELLMLDYTNEVIRNLSGGEQRRVSLAVALINRPELLILDEPTVGIDPIVRKTVWNYLMELSQEENTTIIITTHYIEEARQADTVAMMREGSFLAEEPPESLISRFGCENLEDAFLKLSTIQHKKFVKVQDSESRQSLDEIAFVDPNNLPSIPLETKHRRAISDFIPKLSRLRIQALLYKGFVWMARNLPTMSFVTLLPMGIMCIFCYAIGKSPVEFPVAIINHETQNSISCDAILACNNSQLSCCYTRYLENLGVNLVYYDNESEAVDSVFRGKNYASIVIKRNYTRALLARLDDMEFARSWDIEYSEIDVFRDVTNKQIAIYLKMYLYKTFQDFLQDYMEVCGKNRRALKLPINFEEPIYGIMEPNFTDSSIPGAVLVIVFILAVGTTSVSMLMERNEGSLERTYTIGILDEEFLLTHFICEFFVTLMQIVLTIFATFYISSMTMKGSLVLVFLICCFSGICGMCYGLFISCICDSEYTASMMATGSLVPILVVCGLIWPVEAMHYALQPLVYVIPFTTATASLRSILQRGWNITKGPVFFGFVSLGGWSLILVTISLIILKIKK